MELQSHTQDNNGSDISSAAFDLFKTGGGHSSSATFVKPGSDPLELLMRTVFRDEKQVIHAIMLYSKCRRFKFKRGIDDLRALCAAKCSIEGRSTTYALMAEVQALAPTWNPVTPDNNKKQNGFFGRNKKVKVENNDD